MRLKHIGVLRTESSYGRSGVREFCEQASRIGNTMFAPRLDSNIAALLTSEGASWHDVVCTTCYLRDIDRDYNAFNEERTAFYEELGLNPLPASTGIQAKLCRPELLIEIEAIAMFRRESSHDGCSTAV